jgi:hypothetical protein
MEMVKRIANLHRRPIRARYGDANPPRHKKHEDVRASSCLCASVAKLRSFYATNRMAPVWQRMPSMNSSNIRRSSALAESLSGWN